MRLLLALPLFITLPAAANDPEVQLPFERPHAHETIKGHFHTGWESHYLSEGRDTLDGDSLWASSYEFGWNHVTGGLWYGSSPDQDYDEAKITLGVVQSTDDLEYYFAFTHLLFPFADLDDNELGAGISWSGLPGEFELTADASYSFDAKGSFWEFALNREFTLSDKVTLNTAGLFGVNQGFVSDGHDGANHVALWAGFEFALTDSLAITTHIAHSWALQKDSFAPGDEQLIDLFHGGFGIQWSY